MKEATLRELIKQMLDYTPQQRPHISSVLSTLTSAVVEKGKPSIVDNVVQNIQMYHFRKTTKERVINLMLTSEESILREANLRNPRALFLLGKLSEWRP